MSVTAVKSAEKKYLANDGVIDAGEATKLVKAAGKDAEAIGFLRDILQRDGFSKTKVNGKTAEDILDAKVGSQILATVPTATGSLKISIKEELGPTKGFRTEELARAAAVASGKTSAVLLGKDGRWHAYATKAVATTEKVPGTTNQISPRKDAGSNMSFVYPDDRKPNSFATDVKAIKELEKGDLSSADRDAKYKALLARSLGVSEDKIKICRGPNDYEAGKINFDYRMKDTTENGVVLGKVVHLGSPRENKDGTLNQVTLPKDKTTAIPESYLVISPKALEGGIDKLQGTYMHELTHVEHMDVAKQHIRDFRKSGTKLGFDAWAKQTVKDPAEWRMLDGFTTDPRLDGSRFATTEFLAHGEEFMKTFTRTAGTDERMRYGHLNHMNHEPVSDSVRDAMIARLQRWSSTLSQGDRDLINKRLATYTEGNLSGVRV